MLPCVPSFLVRRVRRAAPAKASAAGVGAGVGGTVGAVRAVRRVSRPLRVCRDAGALSLVAAGPSATPAEAPPPSQPARGGPAEAGGGNAGFAVQQQALPSLPKRGGPGEPGSEAGSEAGSGTGTGDPGFALLPQELLFGANLPVAPPGGGGPDGQVGPPARAPEIPPPYPTEVPEPAALLWLPLALALVVLLRRMRSRPG